MKKLHSQGSIFYILLENGLNTGLVKRKKFGLVLGASHCRLLNKGVGGGGEFL